MNRLGIFCFYDKDGIVGEHIEYLLEDIIKNVSDLCIVCNGILNDAGKAILKKYTNDVLIRENIGFDGGAYKQALENHIGFDNLKKYDELLLFNDSFYGPVYPFEEVFDKMRDRECDFWGLLNHGEIKSVSAIKKHIQSYFLVFRKNMICSEIFQKFWFNLKSFGNLAETNMLFEIELTQYFEKNGFRGDALVDAAEHDKKNNYISSDWSIMRTIELVEEYRFPIIKRKALTEKQRIDILGKHILEYLKNQTQYDTYMIWEHLIRILNTQQLYEKVGLHYSLPHEFGYPIEIKEKTGIFIHMYYEHLVEYCFSYIKNIPNDIDIYISTANNNTYDLINNKSKNMSNIKKVVLLPNRGRDMASLLVGMKEYIKNYDIFCFLHDKTTNRTDFIVNGDIFRDSLWNDTIRSREYIYNIINLFYSNKKIGVVSTPYPISFKKNTNFWSKSFEKTKIVCDMLNIDADLIDYRYQPFALGTAFWCRKNALIQLLDYPFKLEDFPEEPMDIDGTISHGIERCLPFVAKHNGYATVVAESSANVDAKLLSSNLSCKINSLENDLRIYMSDYDACYLYGYGGASKEVVMHLNSINIKINGYIVSDIEKKRDEYINIPVYQIDELQDLDNVGIIITTNMWISVEIAKELRKRNINHYFAPFLN